MFIVHVTPIAKVGLNQLSYFSAHELPIGSIVEVPLRNKNVPALVLKQEEVRDVKASLRTNTYETKKIEQQEPLFLFSAEFVRAAQKTATYFASSVGAVIQSYTPTAILTAAHDGTLEKPRAQQEKSKSFEKLVLQLSSHDRMEKYKTIIRGHFAQGESIFLCVPTTREARRLGEMYERGIEQYTFVLESSQSAKKQQETWNAILKEEHPVLIIATPTYASIPRGDIAMFILEHEMSSAYKQRVRPHIDARILIEHLARDSNCTLVYAGTTVSLAVQHELRNGFATELEEHTRTLRTVGTVHVIDSKAVRIEAKEKKEEFPALSPETLRTLTHYQHTGGRTFIFSARRGIASQTICNDCSAVLRCPQCTSPMVLHERREERELVCHRCGTVRGAHETCSACGSWNLQALGVGIERVEEYVRAHLPDAEVFTISSDATPTPKRAQTVADAFYETPGSVLIGTEMALSYLTEDVSCSVMSSIDSLLCVPDFRIEEKIFGIIATLREHTINTVIIETSSPENAMLRHAKIGSIEGYAHEELALREKLQYPPYTRLIKVTCNGSRGTVIRDMQKFVDLTSVYSPRVFGAFIPAERGSTLHALIRIPQKNWPQKELVQLLQILPPSFEVDVDPERTL